eukprot:scaffold91130_cov106-Phaeocystis_antarctica.AAC.1
MLLCILAVLLANAAADPLPAVDIGTAEGFALLTKAGITTTGVTSVTGDIGTSPITGAAMTGFGITLDATGEFSISSLVSGRLYAADYAIPTPAILTKAISDMEAAYVDAAGRPNPDTVELGAGLIGGTTLMGGVHKWSTVVTVPVGQKLYFDAQGNDDTVWIMQIAQGLNFMADSEVVLLNGAKPSNIFWQVAGVATILAGAHAEGIILCATAITFGAGGSLNGCGLAQTSVTMLANRVTCEPSQPPPPPLPPSPPPLHLLVRVTDNGGAEGALTATVFVNVNTRVYITGDHANALVPHVSMAWFVPAGASCGGPPSQLINPVYGGFLGANHSVEVTLPTLGVFMACTLVAPSGIGRRLSVASEPVAHSAQL